VLVLLVLLVLLLLLLRFHFDCQRTLTSTNVPSCST
jgi:hypothetical protein